jgi:two-component system C4-dicarboxylate transport sensor histidine kinase DctB
MKENSQRQKNFLILIVIVTGLVLTIKLVQLSGLRTAYNDMYQQSTQQLNNLINLIKNTLGRFEKVPEVLSTHSLLQDVLAHPGDLLKRDKLNLLLEEVSDVTQASDIYLIDKNGLTLAASNWRKNNSFVGSNFKVRPYFLQAMTGVSSHYYAVGLNTYKRGYYFAHPVTYQEKIIGVVAVKISISAIENQHEQLISGDLYNFLIVAPDNVIFISDRKEWRLRKIDFSGERAKPLDLKRYADRDIQKLELTKISSPFFPPTLDANLYQINDSSTQEIIFSQQARMEDANWQVHIWSSLKPIHNEESFLVIVSIGGYLLLVILVLFVKERINNSQQSYQARLLLEKRVKERTEDLTTTNHKLLAEIEQRENTQRQLEKIQEELIQSAKLAVIGNMSASINHEINQPLTALKSYSQNALTYQARGMTSKVTGNLNHIIALIDRLASIVSQFKNFTKKSTGIHIPVHVQNSINETLAIIKHQAQNEKVQIFFKVPEQDFYILGDGIRLEQVFVNILSNAIQAMKDIDNKQVYIQIKPIDSHLQIAFRDNGPGILDTNIDKIFEPFFTTKESFGLGIGLSISQRIIESMQGQLITANHSKGGAVFTITLPLHSFK